MIFRRGGSFFCLFACAGWEHVQQNRKKEFQRSRIPKVAVRRVQTAVAPPQKFPTNSQKSVDISAIIVSASPPARISWMFPTLAHLTTVPSHIGEHQQRREDVSFIFMNPSTSLVTSLMAGRERPSARIPDTPRGANLGAPLAARPDTPAAAPALLHRAVDINRHQLLLRWGQT